MTTLTEATAAKAFAKAWNQLDPTEFIALLDANACYASQWVFEELVGRDAIADYLGGKIRTVKANAVNAPQDKVYAELGITTTGFSGRDCAILAQGAKENVAAVVLFEVSNGKVTRYDMCMPELLNVARSGEYPV